MLVHYAFTSILVSKWKNKCIFFLWLYMCDCMCDMDLSDCVEPWGTSFNSISLCIDISSHTMVNLSFQMIFIARLRGLCVSEHTVTEPRLWNIKTTMTNIWMSKTLNFFYPLIINKRKINKIQVAKTRQRLCF